MQTLALDLSAGSKNHRNTVLSHVLHYSGHSTYILSFDLHNNPVRQVDAIIPIFQMRKGMHRRN